MTQPNPFSGIGLTYPRRSKLFPESWPASSESQSVVRPKELDLRMLLQFSQVSTVLAQIEDRTMSLFGGVSCTLKLSFGSLVIHTHQNMLPYEFANGTWLEATVLLARDEMDYHRLIEAVPVNLQIGHQTTSWVPLSPCVRTDHLRRLAALLSKLDPHVQAIFAGATADSLVHRNLLSRVAAADHHVYPGGLLDCSVEAAEIVWTDTSLSKRERGVGALICLLFDLGKTKHAALQADFGRLKEGLKPHPMSISVLEDTLKVVNLVAPALVSEVRTLMSGLKKPTALAPASVPPSLEQIICKAIVRSWKIDLASSGNGFAA